MNCLGDSVLLVRFLSIYESQAFRNAGVATDGPIDLPAVSPYIAAQQAVQAWEGLPQDARKTFIYTGNILNVTMVPVPLILNLGMGKSASAYWVGVADTLYTPRGYRYVSFP